MQVKDIVYMIMDMAKNFSDDSDLTEDHVAFLVKKYRSFLIRKELEKEKEQDGGSLEFETQELCLGLERVEAIPGLPCEGGYYLRTKEKIPKILDGTVPTVYPVDFYGGINIAFVPRGRMRFVGTNKFLTGIIYCSIGSDTRLYLKSANPQFLYLERLRLSAVFEDFDEATELLCDGSSTCDILDAELPIRAYLVPSLIELVLKQVLGVAYRPKDNLNNAKDDLSDLMAFMRANTKPALQQQMEG